MRAVEREREHLSSLTLTRTPRELDPAHAQAQLSTWVLVVNNKAVVVWSGLVIEGGKKWTSCQFVFRYFSGSSLLSVSTQSPPNCEELRPMQCLLLVRYNLYNNISYNY